MNVRKITSLTMLISFVLCILTSVVLYVVPHGRVAYWSDWRLWGLSKTQWGDLHLNLGILLLFAGVLHLYYNWQPMLAYLKDKSKQLRVVTVNFNIALLLTVVVGLGTYFQIPPMSSILAMGSAIKDSAGRKYGEPPYGHAELSSLKMFVKNVDLDLAQSIKLLRQAGIVVANETQTIKEISQQNDLTPNRLYGIMKPVNLIKGSVVSRPFPDSPSPGFGRQTLAEVCSGFGLDLTKTRDLLTAKGIAFDSGQSIKEIATANDLEPMAFFELLRDVSEAP